MVFEKAYNPDSELLKNQEDEHQKKPVENIFDGLVTTDRKSHLNQRKRSTSPSTSQTTTQVGTKKAGRRPVRAMKFGPKKTIGWATFDAQDQVLTKLQELSDVESRSKLFEIALSLAVQAHLGGEDLNNVDLSYAQDPMLLSK